MLYTIGSPKTQNHLPEAFLTFISMYYAHIITSVAAILLSFNNQAQPNPVRDEVIYHVFLRSFYDSNGDQHGDLKGLQSKLDYLQELGVTSILLLPLYHSEFYHNYFATDFETIDPEFGTMEDYLALVRDIHRRSMKIYMDMETQYVTEDHAWYKDSYGNPESQYSNFLVYHGPGNTLPESIIWDLTELQGHDGKVRKVTTVNLLSDKVLAYNKKLFGHWVDPNKDGNFEDGVDGFRLDHMMDDLDWKGKFTDLFDRFWGPLITETKEINPAVMFIGEHANWESYGAEYLSDGKVDRIFAFNLMQAFPSFDRAKVARIIDSSFAGLEDQQQLIILLENHDSNRFASAVESHPEKQKLGAAFTLLLGGSPQIYYGQEIGMTGKGGFGMFGNTDGNDIPRREAFEWYQTVDTQGMALWYKGTGPWWDGSSVKSNDGISVEEQYTDPNSLWHTYRNLIALRKGNPVLISGTYRFIPCADPDVFAFVRKLDEEQILVVMNFSEGDSTFSIQTESSLLHDHALDRLYGDMPVLLKDGAIVATLPAYSFVVLKLN